MEWVVHPYVSRGKPLEERTVVDRIQAALVALSKKKVQLIEETLHNLLEETDFHVSRANVHAHWWMSVHADEKNDENQTDVFERRHLTVHPRLREYLLLALRRPMSRKLVRRKTKKYEQHCKGK